MFRPGLDGVLEHFKFKGEWGHPFHSPTSTDTCFTLHSSVAGCNVRATLCSYVRVRGYQCSIFSSLPGAINYYMHK